MKLRKYLLEGTARQKGFDILEKKLLFLGGKSVLYTYEEDLEKLLKRGKVFKGTVKIMAGDLSQCHRNTAALWDANKGRVKIVTGWAMNDNTWRQHSWGLAGRTVIETVSKRDIYFGYVLNPKETDEFYWENI